MDKRAKRERDEDIMAEIITSITFSEKMYHLFKLFLKNISIFGSQKRFPFS